MNNVFQLFDGGLLQWDFWRIAACTLLTTHLAIVAVTVYPHRCQAHRALELPPLAAHVFRLWSWLYAGMATREWLERHFFTRYTWQGDGLLLVADMLMFGAIGATVWGVQMLWIPVCWPEYKSA